MLIWQTIQDQQQKNVRQMLIRHGYSDAVRTQNLFLCCSQTLNIGFCYFHVLIIALIIAPALASPAS